MIAADIRETVSDLQRILGDRSSVDPSPQVHHEEVVTQTARVAAAARKATSGDGRAPPVPARAAAASAGDAWDMECIVEEALTNAAKHGQAETVHVILDVEHDDSGEPLHVVLSITDDGTTLVR